MDKDTFVRQITALTDRLYRVAYTILQNNEDCKDALQETALKAWEKRDTLRDPALFDTWATRILINACYTICRKRRKSVPLEDAPEPQAPPRDPTLALMLQSLPEKLRLPLVLRCAEGMDYKEIARVLKLPLPTVAGRIRRGKQLLRKELEA